MGRLQTRSQLAVCIADYRGQVNYSGLIDFLVLRAVGGACVSGMREHGSWISRCAAVHPVATVTVTKPCHLRRDLRTSIVENCPVEGAWNRRRDATSESKNVQL